MWPIPIIPLQYWMALGIIIIVLIIIIGVKVYTEQNYFGKADDSFATVKHIEIPVKDGLKLKARFLMPNNRLDSEGNPREALPLILVNHGWNSKADRKYQYALGFCAAGYAVLIYDCRGHGDSPGKKIFRSITFDDIPYIVDFAYNLPEIDKNRIGFFGVSMGGMIGLTRIYKDERVKAIVSVCAPHDIIGSLKKDKRNFKQKLVLLALKWFTPLKLDKFTEEDNRAISPAYFLDPNNTERNKNVFLIHAEDDSLVLFPNFERNREKLGLGPENYLTLKKGDHQLLGQELTILGAAISFFKSRGI